jgi:hypothetical protein
MTGSRRMQGIIIFAFLPTQYAHWFAQKRIGLSHRSAPQGTEHKNQAAALCDLCDLCGQVLPQNVKGLVYGVICRTEKDVS